MLSFQLSPCRRRWQVMFLLLVLVGVSGCARSTNPSGSQVTVVPQATVPQSVTPQSVDAAEIIEPIELVVLTLSRGSGVPDAAHAAFGTIVDLLKAEGLTVKPVRWGLEGERRLCVTLPATLLDRIRGSVSKASAGVELLRVTEKAIDANLVKADCPGTTRSTLDTTKQTLPVDRLLPVDIQGAVDEKNDKIIGDCVHCSRVYSWTRGLC